MITKLAICNYRSIPNLALPLTQLNVVTGPNGCGKSSLYRALRLLGDTAQGRILSSLANEGGFSSSLWAGPEKISRSMLEGSEEVQGTIRSKPVNLRLGFSSDTIGYCIDLGLPVPRASLFNNDPEIKRECVWWGEKLRPSCLFADRRGPLVRIRGADDEWIEVIKNIATFDSIFNQCCDPRTTPDLLSLRESIRNWRFYDTIRIDAHSPVRTPQVGTYSPILDHDGSNVAATIQTIKEIGDYQAFEETIQDGFSEASVQVDEHGGWFELSMCQRGVLRPLKSAELSDGTLRYILLAAALLTPRPPEMMVLNEPEASLHPDLFPALGRLIVRASKKSQVIVVSHAKSLVSALSESPDCQLIELEKKLGATQLKDEESSVSAMSWVWPSR